MISSREKNDNGKHHSPSIFILFTIYSCRMDKWVVAAFEQLAYFPIQRTPSSVPVFHELQILSGREQNIVQICQNARKRPKWSGPFGNREQSGFSRMWACVCEQLIKFSCSLSRHSCHSAHERKKTYLLQDTLRTRLREIYNMKLL